VDLGIVGSPYWCEREHVRVSQSPEPENSLPAIGLSYAWNHCHSSYRNETVIREVPLLILAVSGQMARRSCL